MDVHAGLEGTVMVHYEEQLFQSVEILRGLSQKVSLALGKQL